MWGIDYKKRLEDALADDMRKFLDDRDLSNIYELPILGYADADDPRFTRLVKAGLTKHPKEIYRPGNTVIINFLPFNFDYVKTNLADKNNISREWTFAYENAIFISSHINGFIQKTLTDMGREVSLTSLPDDWDENIYGPEWNHKYAGYIAGMGKFGTGGFLHAKAGPIGRFNSVITELELEPTTPVEDEANIIEEINISSMYSKTGKVITSEDVAEVCPGRAIHCDGIDRVRCMSFCRTLGQSVPEPEVCGKCVYSTSKNPDQKKIKYTDRKIIWKLNYPDESTQEFEDVVEFQSFLDDKIKSDGEAQYKSMKIVVDEVLSIVTTNSILNNLRDHIEESNKIHNLGLDLGFVKRYQVYGLHRDQKKLVVKFQLK